MAAAANAQSWLDVLDEIAFVQDIDADIRAVVTRIANRGRTSDEADDIKLLMACRERIASYKTFLAQHHPNYRR